MVGTSLLRILDFSFDSVRILFRWVLHDSDSKYVYGIYGGIEIFVK